MHVDAVCRIQAAYIRAHIFNNMRNHFGTISNHDRFERMYCQTQFTGNGIGLCTDRPNRDMST